MASFNYSIFSIPAYLVLAMAPHMYSSSLLIAPNKPKTSSSTDSKTKAQKLIYNMPNPRSTKNADIYTNSISAEAYAKYERARAAHQNMLENSAFFVSAVLAGVVTRCEASFMNRMLGLYMLSRVAYLFAYVRVSRGPAAYLRTLWFMAGNGLLVAVWWAAAKRVMNGDY